MGATRLSALMLGIVCLFAVAGCGGSSNQDLTKAEFSQQAGEICKESEEKRVEIISKVAETADPKGDPQVQQEEFINMALPTYEEAAEQIDALGAPKGEDKKVKALIEAMEEAAAKANSDPHTAVTSNIFFRQADQLLEEWKLSGCII